MPTSKSKNQLIHFKKRLYERYNITLNRQDINNIISLIQHNQATFLGRYSNRLSLFDITYNDLNFRALYDKERKTLVTALTSDMQ